MMTKMSTSASAYTEKPKKLSLNKETVRRLATEDPDNLNPTPTATGYKTCLCTKGCAV
ncbi:MAG TPA: hypothetical protein VFA07_06975 [Chthonomonadaceae bacterium]|nr:hypothetical protein [Chthonomonadaceae bacterium]